MQRFLSVGLQLTKMEESENKVEEKTEEESKEEKVEEPEKVEKIEVKEKVEEKEKAEGEEKEASVEKAVEGEETEKKEKVEGKVEESKEEKVEELEEKKEMVEKKSEEEGKEEVKEKEEKKVEEKEEKAIEERKVEERKEEIEKKRRINKKNLFIFVGIAVLIILALFFILKKPVEGKELLNITYSIKLENGTVIDSGTRLFEAGNIAYALGFKTDKLDKEIATMKEGEERNITLMPEDAYGIYNESLRFVYNRTEKTERESEMNKTQTLSIDDFKRLFNEQPEINKSYTLPGIPWPLKVIEKNETHVTLEHQAQVNDEVPAFLFSYRVVNITEDKIVLRLEGNNTVIPMQYGNLEINFTDNYVITTLTPTLNEWIELPLRPKAKVIGLNETHILLDANDELAGKTVIVSIKLNKRMKERVTGKAIAEGPTMQVFIMSYCPFGAQFVKGLLPVWKKFKDKANIELRFVSYTMHGQKEEEENKRMICIREEQSSKLIPYLECFYFGTGNADECIKEVGINKAKLDSCMESRAENYFEKDKELNELYGVRGSPTVVIDGNTVEIWPRSPENIKEKLCEFFKEKPNECYENLSNKNPSPGFGGGESERGGFC